MKMKDIFKFKKGAIGLGDVPGLMLSLVFIVTIGVAIYLVLAGLASSTTDTNADGSVGNFTTTMNNIISFAPTWGTVLGVAVLIGIVIAAFAFGRKYV